jgi:hypothetical protein
MGCDLPAVAPRIFDHGASISIWHFPWLFNWLRTKRQRLLESLVSIGDIDIQE